MNSDQTTERLRNLNRYLEEKNRRLKALIQLCAQHPAWPIEAMVRQYSTALDDAGISRQIQTGASTHLGPRQRSGATKRQHSRETLVAAAVTLILAGEASGRNFTGTVARKAGVSTKTLYSHFVSKNELLVVAYDHLVRPMLDE